MEIKNVLNSYWKTQMEQEKTILLFQDTQTE